jgi:hemolysin activation/secretion protein
VGRDLTVLAAHGSAISRSAYAIYPLLRSQRARLTATVTLEQKALTDFIDATETVTDRRIKLASFGLLGILQDDLNGRGVSGVSVTAAWGRLNILSADALAIDQASARTEGSFNWVLLHAMRLQRLSDADTLALTLSGQYAGKNLNSSEKFALGGSDAVRAYPPGEAIGDTGYVASLELRHAINASLQGVAFYDAGSITINRHPFGGPAANSRHLAGAGVGLRGTYAQFKIKAFVAWRTAGGLPDSIPAGAAHAPTWLAEATLSF